MVCGRSSGFAASAIEAAQELVAVAPRRRLRQRHVGVAEHAANRGKRRLASNREGDDRCKRVDVGPWALLHVGDFGVLLDRRVARLRITVSACVMSLITWRAAPKSSSSGRPVFSSMMLSGAISR